MCHSQEGCAAASVNNKREGGMGGSSRSEGAGKERLKWTQELHDLFEKAVNQLGGPDSKSQYLSLIFILVHARGYVSFY